MDAFFSVKSLKSVNESQVAFIRATQQNGYWGTNINPSKWSSLVRIMPLFTLWVYANYLKLDIDIPVKSDLLEITLYHV